MTSYIVLLRGINVNGQKLIKMDYLKSIFESLPFHDVKTYIQSGNVIFKAADEGTDLLGRTIESKLHEVLDYEVPVIVRTIEEVEEVIAESPYQSVEPSDNEKVYVSFLGQKPTAEAIAKLQTFNSETDDFIVRHREVYILCRGNYGKSLFSNNFLEKKLGVTATTRNWQTINKLASLGRQL